MPNFTPMMEQYFTIKNQYQYCILFFRLGDFFEMFFDDALIASKELDIALTGRDCGQAERAPMCGVPAHAADGYIARLVEKGYHVAICDQVEDAKHAKGIVKRDVVRVVTPGTITDANMLNEGQNNYICALFADKQYFSLATADVTTGVFMATRVSVRDPSKLFDELSRLHPAELILPEGFALKREAENIAGLKATPAPMWMFYPANAYKCLTAHFKTHHLEGFGLKERDAEILAAGALLQYLSQTQKNALAQITAIKPYLHNQYMTLDASSRRNLELVAAVYTQSKKGSLLGVLDSTKTAMGARLLRQWVQLPLISPADINKRLDAVAEWKAQALLRAELKELLHSIHDLERLMSRLCGRNATARDLAALRQSLKTLPGINALLADLQSPIHQEIRRTYDDLSDLYARIGEVIVETPPVSVREGGMIRPGYHAELDELLSVKQNGQQWLAQLEAREKEATGIKNLKVRYNRVFGYYIEITKSQLDYAPAHYTRRQTLANCERFITDELKKLEDTILNADEKQTELEYELFDALRREVVEQMARVQFTAMAVATLDVLQSLADVADRNRYTRPTVNSQGKIHISEGRHPVVEGLTPHAFIPNDTRLDNADHRLSILTGPNMAGKSTYMRQVALITLMAQMGSFVPAREAVIGVVDRIFTRVGASDDLATGQSTFMVEMTEVANILNNATPKSLILLDEIGRGTSTFDGLSIAWAVLEYIADLKKIGAKTLFATHYHELTELQGQVAGVVNYCFTVREQGEEIIFLRKLAPGGADHSYGIHVARLAGLPAAVLSRARGLLNKLNAADIAAPMGAAVPEPHTSHEGLSELERALLDMDIDAITPLEAIMELDRLKNIVVKNAEG
jgi:DNA mismatch repair protein MutS